MYSWTSQPKTHVEDTWYMDDWDRLVAEAGCESVHISVKKQNWWTY